MFPFTLGALEDALTWRGFQLECPAAVVVLKVCAK
jgi:hypothetical protein